MILFTYLIKEIFYIFIKIFAILLIILLALQFNKLLSYEYINIIPISILFKIIFFSIPEIFVKLSPLVFSLSISIFFYKFNKNNEIFIFYLSGYSNFYFILVIKVMSIFFFIIIFILVMFVNPICSKNMNNSVNKEAYNINNIKKRTFNIFINGNFMIYFEYKNKVSNKLNNIFLIFNKQIDSKFNLILANSGYIKKIDNKILLFLKHGFKYEGNINSKKIKFMKFYKLNKYVKINNIYISNINFENGIFLFKNKIIYKNELYWRMSLPILFVVLSILSVSLFFLKNNIYINVLNNIFLYFIYNNLLVILKNSYKFNLFFNFYIIHIYFLLFLFFIFILNYLFVKYKI